MPIVFLPGFEVKIDGTSWDKKKNMVVRQV